MRILVFGTNRIQWKTSIHLSHLIYYYYYPILSWLQVIIFMLSSYRHATCTCTLSSFLGVWLDTGTAIGIEIEEQGNITTTWIRRAGFGLFFSSPFLFSFPVSAPISYRLSFFILGFCVVLSFSSFRFFFTVWRHSYCAGSRFWFCLFCFSFLFLLLSSFRSKASFSAMHSWFVVARFLSTFLNSKFSFPFFPFSYLHYMLRARRSCIGSQSLVDYLGFFFLSF